MNGDVDVHDAGDDIGDAVGLQDPDGSVADRPGDLLGFTEASLDAEAESSQILRIGWDLVAAADDGQRVAHDFQLRQGA